MIDPAEISERLREQKITIQKMAYALTLAAPDSASRIEREAHCVCEWINDACEALLALPDGNQP